MGVCVDGCFVNEARRGVMQKTTYDKGLYLAVNLYSIVDETHLWLTSTKIWVFNFLRRGDVRENSLSSALTFELIGNVIILLQAS